jgi:hypothetical protein
MTFVFAPPVTRVTKQDDINEIRRLLNSLSPEMRRIIEPQLLALAKSATADQILAAMRAGRFSDAMNAVDFTTLGVTLGQELTPALRKALDVGAKNALAEFPGELGQALQIPDVLATEFAAKRAARLVKDVNVATKAAIRQTVTRTFTDGLGMADAAKEIQSVIGLTTKQATAVTNFRRGLEQVAAGDASLGSLRSRYALSRDVLRGRVRPGNIDSLVNRYQARFMRHRAQVIAEHETFTALHTGRQQMWRQMAEVGAIDPATDLQEWIVVADDATCEICLPNHGERRKMGEPFPSGDTAPPAHIGCRCDIRIVTPEVDALGTSEGRRRADRVVDARRDRLARPLRPQARPSRTLLPTTDSGLNNLAPTLAFEGIVGRGATPLKMTRRAWDGSKETITGTLPRSGLNERTKKLKQQFADDFGVDVKAVSVHFDEIDYAEEWLSDRPIGLPRKAPPPAYARNGRVSISPDIARELMYAEADEAAQAWRTVTHELGHLASSKPGSVTRGLEQILEEGANEVVSMNWYRQRMSKEWMDAWQLRTGTEAGYVTTKGVETMVRQAVYKDRVEEVLLQSARRVGWDKRKMLDDITNIFTKGTEAERAAFFTDANNKIVRLGREVGNQQLRNELFDEARKAGIDLRALTEDALGFRRMGSDEIDEAAKELTETVNSLLHWLFG